MPSFYSPLRKAYSPDRPGYPYDKPIAALPGLIILPEPSGEWYVTVFLLTGPVTSRPFYTTVSDISALLSAWADDPERVMVEIFNYKPPVEVLSTPKSKIPSLFELGL